MTENDRDLHGYIFFGVAFLTAELRTHDIQINMEGTTVLTMQKWNASDWH